MEPGSADTQPAPQPAAVIPEADADALAVAGLGKVESLDEAAPAMPQPAPEEAAAVPE
eukprot:COSAG06_NODE_44688_length_361_cov_0.923664_1_plen_57_part_10